MYVRLNSQKALKCLQITSYRHPAKIQFIAGHFSFTADQRIKPFFFGNTILKANDRRLPVPINKVTVRQYSDNQLRQQVAKLLRHFHQKTPFPNFQYSAYLEFKPFPLPLPSPPFNVDCLSSQHFFVSLATLIRGGGGLQCER